MASLVHPPLRRHRTVGWLLAFVLVVQACSSGQAMPDVVSVQCPTGESFPLTAVGDPVSRPEFLDTALGVHILDFYTTDPSAGDEEMFDRADGFVDLGYEAVGLIFDDEFVWVLDFVPRVDGLQLEASYGCKPRIAGDGLVAERWDLDTRSATADDEVAIQVLLGACANRDDKQTVSRVDTVETQESVTITAWGTVFEPSQLSCAGVGNSEDILVQLEQPLGDRVILDGSTIPAKPPWNAPGDDQ
ncbi:hypothetical protein MNBD_ACTINO02-2323 [hydrothermal vent metagenome]|uniref:Uncharacterized protein n=1 Tax=hydrothermal vent metagenome TaxID=652676 RepID=A0A3B0TC82_9ZZZZ